jgi:hypothetical protein
LLQRGVNLSVPTATEAPRINSCTSGWQRELPLHTGSNSADDSMYDASTAAAAGATAGVRVVNTMSTTRRTQQRTRCRIEYETGDLVLFTAATADTVPEFTVIIGVDTTSCGTDAAASDTSIKQQQQQQKQQQQHDSDTTLCSATAAAAIAGAATGDSSSDAQPQEMYGVVLDKPLQNHGEWGHAERRGGTDEHYYRLQVST